MSLRSPSTWLLMLLVVIMAGPYLTGVRPKSRRDWLAITVTIAFLIWLLATLEIPVRSKSSIPRSSVADVAPSSHTMCVAQPPACFAFSQAVAVFTGTVTRIEPRSGDEDFGKYIAHLRVIESFKGPRGPMLVLHQNGLSAEDFRFDVGRRVLVYAYGSEESLGTSQCSRTRIIETVDREVDLLRLLVSGRSGGLVAGSVIPRDWPDTRNLAVALRGRIRKVGEAGSMDSVDSNSAGQVLAGTPWSCRG